MEMRRLKTLIYSLIFRFSNDNLGRRKFLSKILLSIEKNIVYR